MHISKETQTLLLYLVVVLFKPLLMATSWEFMTKMILEACIRLDKALMIKNFLILQWFLQYCWSCTWKVKSNQSSKFMFLYLWNTHVEQDFSNFSKKSLLKLVIIQTCGLYPRGDSDSVDLCGTDKFALITRALLILMLSFWEPHSG